MKTSRVNDPRVLILAGLYDFSADLVALQLERSATPYLRLNREHFSAHCITLDPVTPELVVDGPAGVHQLGPDFGSVWFRQPVFLRNTPPGPLSLDSQLERSQWMAFLRGLSVFRGARWMNDLAATYLAESKPYQLAVAAGCGFAVPKTIVTNDGSSLARLFPGDLVVKSLDTVLLHDGDDCLFTYTTVHEGSELADADLSAAPLLAQRFLKRKTDLRITVVGDDLFSVRILRHGKGIPGDWRVVPRNELEYEDVDLDVETSDSCWRLTQKLGLSFAAIDLVETEDGIYFLEVNPTGEWGWLVADSRPLDRVIAGWLQKEL